MKLPPLFIPGCPHRPTLKQWIGLSLPGIRELLYGGAAGGGKSDFLLMAALQYVDQPNYSALLLRRTFPQLAQSGGLLQRASEWLEGRYAEGVDRIGGLPTRYRFPSGAWLSFAHCQHDKDRYNFQSGEYQYIGFDELTQFTERIYLYVMSRLRRLKGSKIPLRVRSASNPGGNGHDWVRSRLVKAHEKERFFLAAKLSDNPYLDGDEYEATLMLLHPYERQQLLDGDWDTRAPGSKFKREWFDVIDEVPGDTSHLLRYWDLASTEESGGNDPDFTAGTRMGRTPGGHYPILDVQHFRATPHAVEARIHQTAKVDGTETKVWIEQEPGSSGKFTIAHFIKQMPGFTVRGHRPTGDKFVRMNPLASQAEAGNVPLVNGQYVEPFLREIEMIGDGGHDDQADSAAGAFEKQHRAAQTTEEALAAWCPGGDAA